MKTTWKYSMMVACLGAGVAMAGGVPVPNPEAPDLDPEISAKIHLQKSKTSTIADGMKQGRVPDGDASGGSCSININSNNQPKSNSGIREMFGKQSTTIVTGPVINTANCK